MIRIGVCTFCAEPAEHLVAVDVRQHQVEEDDVVVVELADLDAVLAELARVDHEAAGTQHQFDGPRGGGVVFDQKDTHR